MGSGQGIDCRQIELRRESVGSLTKGDDLTKGMCARAVWPDNLFRRNSCRLGHPDFTFALREKRLI